MLCVTNRKHGVSKQKSTKTYQLNLANYTKYSRYQLNTKLQKNLDLSSLNKKFVVIKGEEYNLLNSSEHVIGRRDSHLELNDDQSISRKHASINYTLQNGNAKLVLTDLNSKYGTFVNDSIKCGNKLAPNIPINLVVGDQIRFGLQWNTWKVCDIPIVVCSSRLPCKEKSELKSILTKLGGTLVTEWSNNCTHLVTNHITITVKVVCALASVKPIVSIDYWKKLEAAMLSLKEYPLPNSNSYVPNLAEPILNMCHASFALNHYRRCLFDKFTFYVHSDLQYEHLLPMITSAGGTVIRANEKNINELEVFAKKIIVMQPLENLNAKNSGFRSLLRYIELNNLRLIQESEIGLSVIFCSTEKFCNPAFDMQAIADASDDAEQYLLQMSKIEVDSDNEDNSLPKTQIALNSDSFTLTLAVSKREFEESSDQEEERKVKKQMTNRASSSTSSKTNDFADVSCRNIFDEESHAASRSHNETIDSPNISKKRQSLFDLPCSKKTSLCSTLSGNRSIDLFDGNKNKRKSSETDSLAACPIFDRTNKKPRAANRSKLFELPSGKRLSELKPASNNSFQQFFSKNQASPESDKKAFDSSTINNNNNNNKNYIDENTEHEGKCEIDCTKNDVSISPIEDIPSQLILPPVHIKQELADLPPDVEDLLDKTIVLTVSLIPTLKKIEKPTENHNSVNFKKFRKNAAPTLPHIIGGKDLFLHEKYQKIAWNDKKIADDDSDDELF